MLKQEHEDGTPITNKELNKTIREFYSDLDAATAREHAIQLIRDVRFLSNTISA